MLFAGVGAVIYGGLSASMRAARNVRLEAQAADLAVTVVSELQMGLREPVDEGPAAFLTDEDEEDPDLLDWSWQIVTEPVELSYEGPPVIRVAVIIRNESRGYTYRVTQTFAEPREAESFAAGPAAPHRTSQR